MLVMAALYFRVGDLLEASAPPASIVSGPCPQLTTTLRDFTGTLVLVGAGKMGAAMLEGWLGRGLDAARVVVLHVKASLPAAVRKLAALPPEPAEVCEGLREQLSRLWPENADVSVEHQLREGDPATEILALSREIPCDLIVMGTHGRTGLGRLLMGSVAEQVLRRVPCPVLTVNTTSRSLRGSPAVRAAAAVLGELPRRVAKQVRGVTTGGPNDVSVELANALSGR